ncbi:MAG: TolC family protein [Bacteroidota bacterium]
MTFSYSSDNQKIVAFFASFVFVLISLSSIAQEKWSLEKCIDYAKENSLTLKQADYGVQLAALADKQNKLNRLPSINGSSSYGYSFGLGLDPTTNALQNQRIGFNNISVSGNLTLFQGGLINNSIKQGQYDLKASKADAEFAFNTMALNIANAYLQILMAEEQLVNGEKRLGLSKEQLDQTDKMIKAGTLPENDRLEVLAQMARDEQTIIQSQNLIDINYLNLKEFMQLDPNTEIQIEIPEINFDYDTSPEAYTFREVYGTAVNTQPQVMRDEMNLKSAEKGVSIARSGMLPTLTLFGGFDTRWSSASKRPVGPRDTTFDDVTLRVNNEDFVVGFPNISSDVEDTPYFTQLDDNLGKNVGVSLSIPFYNNHRNRIAVERAKVNILNAKLQADLTKQQLKIDIQNALASARAGYRSMKAANKTVEAATAAFENAEKQYELGAINTFQYTTARNNLDIAEIDMTVAKYDYLFRLKIIDFYLGKALKID